MCFSVRSKLTHGTKYQYDMVGCRDRCTASTDFFFLRLFSVSFIFWGKVFDMFVHVDRVAAANVFRSVSHLCDFMSRRQEELYCEYDWCVVKVRVILAVHPNPSQNLFTDILLLFLCVRLLICIDITFYWCIWNFLLNHVQFCLFVNIAVFHLLSSMAGEWIALPGWTDDDIRGCS